MATSKEAYKSYKQAAIIRILLEVIFGILAFAVLFKTINVFEYTANYISTSLNIPSQGGWLVLALLAYIFYKVFILIMVRIIAFIIEVAG